MTQKRSLIDLDMLIPEPKTARLETPMSEPKASKFSAHTLKKLQAAIEENSEVDLTTKMPMNYSARLARFQKESHNKAKEALGKPYKRPQSRKANGYFLKEGNLKSSENPRPTFGTAFALQIPLR